jgi:uncharacterized protein with GYD domain
VLKQAKFNENIAKFVVLSRLTDEGAKTVFERPERIKEVNKELEG